MTWIASRTLVDPNGREVTVAIGAPHVVGPDEWACPYKVTGLATDHESRTGGADALQALLIAIGTVRGLLEESAEPLTWSGSEPGDTGLPLFPTMVWGVALRRHIENLMRIEEEFWESRIGVRVPDWNNATRKPPP